MTRFVARLSGFGRTGMPRVGIITAMATEVGPLIRDWRRTSAEYGGRRYQFFEKDDAVLVCGGIGHEAGRRAAEAVIECARPEMLIATGLAGGLKPEWTLGRTMLAAEVVDEATGKRFATAGGTGAVVSSREIARADKKRELALRFAADVVDMEGAAVAEVAGRHGLPFLAVKAVSDEMDFELPPLQPFVDEQGRFQAARFTMWAAWHPQWWPTIAQLKTRSDMAAEKLAGKLEEVMAGISEIVGERVR
jgi:adenosylhomocysteine nucleosidase